MKPMRRDPVTGRFVQKTKEMEIPMEIQEYDGVSVSLTEAKERKSLVNIIVVLQASYGISNMKVQVDPDKVKMGRKASNRMAGSDPAPKQKKTMTVTVLKKGEQMTKEFNEGEIVNF
jgi:hypothetical protein